MQTLYEWEFRNRPDLEEIVQRNISEYDGKCDKDFISKSIKGVLAEIESIDKTITESAPEWPLDQIPLIDRAILRLSIHELLYSPDVPPKVAINEAVELAKQFGGENSSRFINGVLGTVYDKYEAEILSLHKN